MYCIKSNVCLHCSQIFSLLVLLLAFLSVTSLFSLALYINVYLNTLNTAYLKLSCIFTTSRISCSRIIRFLVYNYIYSLL